MAQERRIFSKDYWGWIKHARAPTLKGFPQQNLLKHKHENRTNPGWLENRRIAMLYEERKPHLNYDLGEKKRIKCILAESSQLIVLGFLTHPVYQCTIQKLEPAKSAFTEKFVTE